MMLQRKHRSKQIVRGAQIADYRRRLRRVIRGAAVRFLETNPQWGEYFFDMRFLLNRGLPIVEAHLAGTTSNGAIDLALAWAAEEWPAMNVEQRRVCLQAQTVIAAELLALVTKEMLSPRPSLRQLAHEQEQSWRGVGIPLAYIKAHNPPGRSELYPQRVESVAQGQRESLSGNKELRQPKHRRQMLAES